MKRFAKVLTAVCLILGIMLSQTAPGFTADAKTVEQYEAELANLAKEKKKVQDELNQISKDKKSINRQKTALDREIDVLEQEISLTEGMISVLSGQITVKTGELNKAQEDENKQYEILKDRIRSNYEEGLPGYLEVILGANGMYDMLTRIDMIGEIFKFDQQVYDKLISIKNDIAQKKLDLETTKTKQEQTVKQLETRKIDRETKYNRSIKLLKDLKNRKKTTRRSTKSTTGRSSA